MLVQSTDNGIDKRIIRTRQLITESLFTLMLEKPFSEIIVKDITEQANVNRSTFYSHYQDKFDLLDKIAAEKLSELSRLPALALQNQNYTPDFDVPDPYFIALFEHITENEAFYRIILTRLPDATLSIKMQEAIRECFFIRLSSAHLDQKMLIPLDILLDYASSSLMGIVKKWIEQQRIYSPHYMALQLTRLSVLGTYKGMGYSES